MDRPGKSAIARLLSECEPAGIDLTRLRMIREGDERLSDGLFFKLISETPAWLGTEPFLKRISEWQYVIDNPIFDTDQQNQAKRNLKEIGAALIPSGKKGRPSSSDRTGARDRWLTIEEEQALLNRATNPQWLRPLLIMALHTGMRRGEILNVTWQDIDFTKRLLRIERSKNGEKRGIPLSRFLMETLRRLKVRGIAGRLFPISERSLRVAFEATVEKAGIENFHFHDLRHTFATRLAQNGVDLYKVKELLGHKSLTMTMRYAHHYPESLRGSIEILDDCYNSATIGAPAFDNVSKTLIK